MVILEDKFLKKIEEIKEDISKINDPLEMVRFLDEIQINTAKWCKQNCPEEVIFENGTEIEITISGKYTGKNEHGSEIAHHRKS